MANDGNTVASGSGWSVSRTGEGFDIRIDRAGGYFGTSVALPATDDQREPAKERLLEVAQTDAEAAAVEAAFLAPWLQA